MLTVDDEMADARFIAYALAASGFPETAEGALSVGATKQVELNVETLRRFCVPAPAAGEQRAIADFLDAETARLDSMVELRRRQARLLAERFRTMQNHKLNPASTAGWVSRRLMQLCDPARPIQYGIVLPGPNVSDGVLLVKGGDVKSGRLDRTLLACTSREVESGYVRSRLRKRDLVFAIRGGVGDVELVPDSIVGANITQDVARIAPLPNVDEMWLLHALRSTCIQAQVEAMITGATIKGINIGDLRRVVIRVPPPRLQRTIGNEVATRSAMYSDLSRTISSQIALLGERRQALITAAVTGKLKISDAHTVNAAA